MKKNLFILIILFFLMISSVLAQAVQNTGNSAPPTENLDYASGVVTKIISEIENHELQESIGGKQVTQRVQVKIVSGKNKGKLIETTNQLSSNPGYDIKVKPGSRVILDIEKKGDLTEYNIADNERIPSLMIALGLFLVLLLAIGGLKGLKSLISLIINTVLVFFVLVPAVLNNLPVIPVTIGIAVLSTLLSMFIICGINMKSVSASIGTLGGVVFAGILSLIIIKIAPLSGLGDQEAMILWSSRPDLNFAGILTSAMIIGALGAIMDIGISIASSIAEVKSIDPSLNTKQLIQSGMNVGRDIMGAMSNTLILAYIGGCLPLILLAANAPLIKLINLNSIATEITAALTGSIGIILSVPMTAIVAGYLMGRKNIWESLDDIKQIQEEKQEEIA